MLGCVCRLRRFVGRFAPGWSSRVEVGYREGGVGRSRFPAQQPQDNRVHWGLQSASQAGHECELCQIHTLQKLVALETSGNLSWDGDVINSVKACMSSFIPGAWYATQVFNVFLFKILQSIKQYFCSNISDLSKCSQRKSNWKQKEGYCWIKN